MKGNVFSEKKAKELYKKIQEKLFYMIPEKWDSVYLYASIIEQFNKLETGEMFFYYFPKGILKRNPVNVYEIPNKFNIDEDIFLKLTETLYDFIKDLRKLFLSSDEKVFSNLTISIEGFRFKVEYSYEDLKNIQYDNYERHLIWKHIYLGTDLNTYNKKERELIQEYLINQKYFKEETKTYEEPMYEKPVKNIIDYEKQINIEEYEELNKETEEKRKKKPDKYQKHLEKGKKKEEEFKKEEVLEEESQIKIQILNFKK